MQIKDKVVAITGAGSGIGRALALHVARTARGVALADVDESGLAQAADDLRGQSAFVTRHVVDVSRRDHVERFAHDVVAQHGNVDVVVNNAGVALLESVDDGTYEDLEWIMNVNFWGVVHGTKSFLPYLVERPEAAIVNMSSIAGLVGLPVQAAYSATKFAIRGFSEAIRLELAGTGVRVFCVHAGGVRTNIVRNARYYKNPEDPTSAPDQVAAAVRFEKHFALTTPDQAAKRIVDCVRRGRLRILIGWDARIVDWLSRFLPNLLPRILMWYAKRNAQQSARRRSQEGMSPTRVKDANPLGLHDESE